MCIAFIEQLIRMEIPEASTNRGWRLMGLFGTFPNPGRFDDLKAAAANLLALDNLEGARFEFNKTMTQKFALLHNVSLAAGQPGSYEFGAHVGDEKTLLASRIDMAGRLTGRVNTLLGDSIGQRLQASVARVAGAAQQLPRRLGFQGWRFLRRRLLHGRRARRRELPAERQPGLAVGAEGFLHTGNTQGPRWVGRSGVTWGGKGEHVLALKAGSFGQGNMAEVAYSRKVRRTPALPSVCPRLSPHAHRSRSDCTRLSRSAVASVASVALRR